MFSQLNRKRSKRQLINACLESAAPKETFSATNCPFHLNELLTLERNYLYINNSAFNSFFPLIRVISK